MARDKAQQGTTITAATARVFYVLRKDSKRWRSSREIAEKAQISRQAAWLNTRLLFEKGVLERFSIASMYRFKVRSPLSEEARRIAEYLKLAAEVLGLYLRNEKATQEPEIPEQGGQK